MANKKPFFKNAALEREFEQNGFVKIPLLDEDTADNLYTFFEQKKEQHPSNGVLHHTTTDTANTDLILEVDKKIKDAFIPALNNFLNEYKPLASCFHVKEIGKGSATGIHQDPTFVDESNYTSANVWVALHDMDATNGNMFFVKGSNRAVNSLRPVPSYPCYYQAFYPQIRERLFQVPMKKGEAVFFHNATIHGATDNSSGKPRIAATLLVCSEQAQWQLFYNNEGNGKSILDQYNIDLNTFINMPKDGRPSKDVLVDSIPYSFPEISFEEFTSKTAAPKSSGILERITSLFK